MDIEGMAVAIIISIILWLVLCFVVAAGANNRGRSYVGFFLISLFLSPLIGLIILLALGKNKDVIEKRNIEKKQLFVNIVIKTYQNKKK